MNFHLTYLLALMFAVFTAQLPAAVPEPGRDELLRKIKMLEEQNAKLAVDATRAKMEAEEARKQYQLAVTGQDASAPEMSEVTAKLWKAEVSLGATASSGNNNAYQVNVGAKGVRTTEIDELILALNIDVGENEGVKSSEKGKATADYRHDVDAQKKWYWLIASSLERDQLADLDYRFTIGPGVGYRFWNTEKFKFALESGPAFVIQKDSNDGVDYSVRGRLGNRMEYQFVKSAKLFQKSDLLFNFQDSDDYIVSSELGVESDLTKVLSLRIYGTHRYENIPAFEKKQNDFSLISALVYKFE